MDVKNLKVALIDNILRRKNVADFDDLKSALTEISRLASLTAPDQESALIDLLKVVTTDKWLARVYALGSTRGLAGALHMIAIHQPPSVIRLFWSYSLGARLRKEFSNVALLTDQELAASVWLLGTSSLAGWRVNRNILFSAPLDRLSQLPQIVKPRPEAEIAEQLQRQLWLGLRVIASICSGALHVDPTAIVETLDLWRKNISTSDWVGTKEKPVATAHRVNVSMVKWLEDCARTEKGLLLPSKEPLWMLAGFPRI